jgi:hypothetical protein
MRLVAGVLVNGAATTSSALSLTHGGVGGSVLSGLSFWAFCAGPESLPVDELRLLIPGFIR